MTLEAMAQRGRGTRWRWALGLALLVVVSCTPTAGLGKPFILWQGKSIRVRGTGWTIEAEQVSDQVPGSQKPVRGYATLTVTTREGDWSSVFVQVNESKRVGEFEIRMQRIIMDAEGQRCELVVSRP